MLQLSSEQKARIIATFKQMEVAIDDLIAWNECISCSNDYLTNPDGKRILAASCMLIEGIGEGIKRINQITNSNLFKLRPEIPWNEIAGIRNHIAHGYFEIDEEIIFTSVKSDVTPLKEALEYLIGYLSK